MRLVHISPAGRRHRALELLDLLGLSDRRHHHPPQLSGGEQQRVAIAVALANQPQILLADEPTGEVDTATALEVYTALRKANQTYGTTILIVSHDPKLSNHTDRVIAIRDGKTSTEQVRVPASVLPSPPQPASRDIASGASGTKEGFEELVVLDSAGRLQLPRQYLEELNIGDRVRLELSGTNIVVHPVVGRGRAAVPEAGLPNPEELYADEDAAPKRKKRFQAVSLRRIVGRFRQPHKPVEPGGEHD
jgi:ABC-type glutathione transport system ATPase component